MASLPSPLPSSVMYVGVSNKQLALSPEVDEKMMESRDLSSKQIMSDLETAIVRV